MKHNAETIYEYIAALEDQNAKLIKQQKVMINMLCSNDEDNKRTYIQSGFDEKWREVYSVVVTELDNPEGKATFSYGFTPYSAVVNAVREYIEWEESQEKQK